MKLGNARFVLKGFLLLNREAGMLKSKSEHTLYIMYLKSKKFIQCLVSSIIKHNIVALAGVIAFFGLSAMIPLAFLLIYGTSIFIPISSVQSFLSDILQSYVPTLPDAQLYIAENV